MQLHFPAEGRGRDEVITGITATVLGLAVSAIMRDIGNKPKSAWTAALLALAFAILAVAWRAKG